MPDAAASLYAPTLSDNAGYAYPATVEVEAVAAVRTGV